ncbi:MAG: peptidyl-prolyl cis-trans isomerase SurA [Sulfitobacter sp.]|jgi:peptidyl-prolyl cis-trans isomerase SurA
MSEMIFSKCAKAARALALVAAATLIGAPAPLRAQNLYAPVVRVDSAVVTEYEVQQRQKFLQVLNAPGADRDSAIDALIDDRLRIALTRQAGIELTEEGITSGLSDFAARAKLSTEEFVKALGQSGVSRETFRDYVTTTLVWRELIRARYLNSVIISEAEIDRALGAGSANSGLRVLLSEIIIPAPPAEAARVNALANQISQTTSEAEFSNYARQYSATASRGAGGRLPWTPLSKMPAVLQPLILGLAPGEVTSPLPIPDAVALFQLRAIQETGAPTQSYSAIDYAAYYIPGGRSEAALAAAARLRANVDVCDDLYGIAKGQPPEVLERETKTPADVPDDFAIELAKLDPGESSTALTRAGGQNLVFLMLCNRTTAANAEVDRAAVVNTLRQEKLQGYADQLLKQLRADARIIRK